MGTSEERERERERERKRENERDKVGRGTCCTVLSNCALPSTSCNSRILPIIVD